MYVSLHWITVSKLVCICVVGSKTSISRIFLLNSIVKCLNNACNNKGKKRSTAWYKAHSVTTKLNPFSKLASQAHRVVGSFPRCPNLVGGELNETGHISVWPFYQTHFSLTFLPETFQFWSFYRAHFSLIFLLHGHISVWPFYRAHFSLTFLPDTFQFNLFTGHISIWLFYRTHFSLTFLPDTFQFDLFTRHISFWPFYQAHFS